MAPKETPPFFSNEKIGPVVLSCFRNQPSTAVSIYQNSPTVPYERFCTEPGKPWLLMYQNSYEIFFNKLSVFEHHIIAKDIMVRDGLDPVLTLQVEELRTAQPPDLASIEPPDDTTLVLDDTPDLPSSVSAVRLLKSVPPALPCGDEGQASARSCTTCRGGWCGWKSKSHQSVALT